MDQAKALSERLGGLPLALHLAGCYLGSEVAELDLPAYLAALAGAARPTELIDEAATVDLSPGRSRIGLTWEISLDALERHGLPQARRILRLLARLAPNTVIPGALLDARVIARYGLIAGESKAEVRAGLSGLRRVGLLPNRPGGPIVVHPVVADAMLDASGEPEAGQELRAAAAILRARTELPAQAKPDDWPTWRLLVVHLRALIDRRRSSAGGDDVMIDIAAAAAQLALGLTDAWDSPADVADFLRNVLRGIEPLGRDHPQTMELVIDLGAVLQQGGQYEKAERINREVLTDLDRVLGRDHAYTLIARSNLAQVLFDRGRYEEAEQMYRAVVTAQTRTIGPDHEQTITTRHNLSFVLAARGRLIEAEEVTRAVLADRERVLGADHPRTLTTRDQLGSVLYLQLNYRQAETVMRQVRDDSARILGPDHVHTLT